MEIIYQLNKLFVLMKIMQNDSKNGRIWLDRETTVLCVSEPRYQHDHETSLTVVV